MAIMWLGGDAQLWSRTVVATKPIGVLTWPELKQLLLAHWRPVDARQKARDELALCKQTHTVEAYTSTFRRILLGLPHLTDDEALDRFVRGL